MEKKIKSKRNGKDKMKKVNNSKKPIRVKDLKSLDSEILHRKSQRDSIITWIKEKTASKNSSFMYVFGPPGTGKTALLKSLIGRGVTNTIIPAKCHYINCMQISTFKILADNINKVIKLNDDKNLKNIQSNDDNNSQNFICVLDEIQQCMIPQILEKFVSKAYSDPLLIIGVANCLSPHNLIQPENTVAFPPYSSSELLDILTAKLAQFDDSFTLELISKKVAGTCGDVRKAINLSKTVLEATFNMKDSPRERMTKILSIIGQSNQFTTPMDDSMPLQQKIIACTLIGISGKSTNIGKLYDQYCGVCKRKKLPVIDFSTFISSCDLMSSNGIVKLVTNKNVRFSKISLSVDETDIRHVLSENELLTSILNNT